MGICNNFRYVGQWTPGNWTHIKAGGLCARFVKKKTWMKNWSTWYAQALNNSGLSHLSGHIQSGIEICRVIGRSVFFFFRPSQNT